MHLLIQSCLLGIITGGVYALMASGLTLAFGVMKVINVAQGVESMADDLAFYAGQYRHAVGAIATMSESVAAAFPARKDLAAHAVAEREHVGLWDSFAEAAGGEVDTAPTPDVQALAAGASVALVEATQLHEKAGIQPGHLTGDLAGSLASVAKVGRLVLTHYVEEFGDELLKQAASAFQGPVELARELETYQV